MRDPAQVTALLQTVASELSQNDQRPGQSLADLRERLDQMVNAEPAKPNRAAVKPALALEDQRTPASSAVAVEAAPKRAIPLAQPILTPAVARHEPAPPANMDQIYAAVASSYGDLAARRALPSAPAQHAQRAIAYVAEPEAEDEDDGFLDLSALAEPIRAPLKAPPVRVAVVRTAPLALAVPLTMPGEVALPDAVVAPEPETPVMPAAEAVAEPATSAPVAAAQTFDQTIDDLARRLALTEAKVDQALRRSAATPANGAAMAQIEGLRAEIEKLTGEHVKVSEEVGRVAADMRELSKSTHRLVPMGDKLELLNEAILTLRKDMPGFAGLAAQEAAHEAVQKAGDRLTGIAREAASSGELADKLATVQNLLLTQSRDHQESNGRSLDALESIRGLVEKLHNRIDALEAEGTDAVPTPAAEQPQRHAPAMAALLAAGQAPLAQQVPPVPLAETPAVSTPGSFPPADMQDVPLAAPASTISREALIASARRAAEVASINKPTPEPEAKRSQKLNPRDLLAKPHIGKLADFFTARGPIVSMLMVALLAMSLGIIYAKFLHKPAPVVAIEQTALPAMPDDLPDPAAKPATAAQKPAAKDAGKPAKDAATPATAASPAAPTNAAPGKSSMLGPDDGATPASASVLPTASTGQQATVAANSVPALDQLPAAIAPSSIRDAAQAGDPSAAVAVAERYLTGKSVARDPVKARHWYEVAAKSGSPLAEFQLGVLYEKGDDGIAADRAQAMDWYRKGADDGNPQAMHNLAVLFAGENGGTPDYASAAKWFEQAANFGLKDSQYNLAVLYQNGLGVEKNAATAYKWFAIDAARGDVEAAKQRDALRKDVPATALAGIEAQVKAWRPKPPVAQSSAMVNGQPSAAPVAMAPTVAEEVASVQKSLSKLGYDPGSLDGTLTAQTREAIRSFEQRSGLPGDGEISDALIAKLKALGG